jgi:16S rRNA (guanine527-N7)-methyltransferase
LAPLEKLLGLAAPLLAADGICLFPKGRGWEAELTAAKVLWHMRVERISAPDWGDSCILKVNQIRHAG